MHQFEFGLGQRLANRSQVDRLTTRHAAGAGSNSKYPDHLDLARRIKRLVAGNDFKGKRLQAVADK